MEDQHMRKWNRYLEEKVLLQLLKHLKFNLGELNRILKRQYLALTESYQDKRVLNEIILKVKLKADKLSRKFWIHKLKQNKRKSRNWKENLSKSCFNFMKKFHLKRSVI